MSYEVGKKYSYVDGKFLPWKGTTPEEITNIQVQASGNINYSNVPDVNITNNDNNFQIQYTTVNGAAGDNSDTPTLYLGNVTTGETAEVDIRYGSLGNDTYEMNITLPKPFKGNKPNTPVISFRSVTMTNPGTTPTSKWILSNGVYYFDVTLPRANPGTNGASGVTPTLGVNSVTTVAYGQPASAELVDNGNGVGLLDITIPKGKPGNAGSTGKKAKLVAGNVTKGTELQTPVFNFVKTDNSTNTYRLDAVLPIGQKGETGANGANAGMVTSAMLPQLTFSSTGAQYSNLYKGTSGASGASGSTPVLQLSGGTSTIGTDNNLTITTSNSKRYLNIQTKSITGNKGATGSSGYTPNISTAITVTTNNNLAATAFQPSRGVANTSNVSYGFSLASAPAGTSGTSGTAGYTPKLIAGTPTRTTSGGNITWSFTTSGQSRTMNLTIPSGGSGASGASGASGSPYKIVAGTISTLASTGTASAWFTSSGSTLTLRMNIPRAPTGATHAAANGAKNVFVLSNNTSYNGTTASGALSSATANGITTYTYKLGKISGAAGADRYADFNCTVANIVNTTAYNNYAARASDAYKIMCSSGLFNTMVKLTASGNWSAPVSGICKFILIGGGGAGGGTSAQSSVNLTPHNGQPGFGGYATVVYETVKKGTAYAYTIGAGGAFSNTANGGAGGNTTIVINGTTYIGSGGSGGRVGYSGIQVTSSACGFWQGGGTYFGVIGTSKGFTMPGNQSRHLGWGTCYGASATKRIIAVYAGEGGQNGMGWGAGGTKIYQTTNAYNLPEPYSGCGGGGAVTIFTSTGAYSRFQSGTSGAAGCIIIHYNAFNVA